MGYAIVCRTKLFSECQKGNNELLPCAQHHKCSCRIMSRHVSILYRSLGHLDNTTVLLHVCRSSASVTRAMILILVYSAISGGQVRLTCPRSLPRHHALHHAQANQAFWWYYQTIEVSFTERQKRRTVSNQISYPLFHSLVCSSLTIGNMQSYAGVTVTVMFNRTQYHNAKTTTTITRHVALLSVFLRLTAQLVCL